MMDWPPELEPVGFQPIPLDGAFTSTWQKEGDEMDNLLHKLTCDGAFILLRERRP